MHHEVPGISIPKYVREKLAGFSKEDAPRYSVEVARTLLVEAKPLVNGAYLMPLASMPRFAGDIVEASI